MCKQWCWVGGRTEAGASLACAHVEAGACRRLHGDARRERAGRRGVAVCPRPTDGPLSVWPPIRGPPACMHARHGRRSSGGACASRHHLCSIGLLMQLHRRPVSCTVDCHAAAMCVLVTDSRGWCVERDGGGLCSSLVQIRRASARVGARSVRHNTRIDNPRRESG